MSNVAIVANCELRNNGTFGYCHRAMKQIEEENGLKVKHYQPRGEIGKHDWYFYVDDGRDELKWIPPHPNAYYAIDTHLGYAYRLWKAKQFDKVFVAQKDAVDKFWRDGVDAEWLPLGCHPEAHVNKNELLEKGLTTQDVEKKYDLAFVGFMNDSHDPGFKSRVDYLDHLQKHFPSCWISTGVFFEPMCVRYVRARLGFNVSIMNDLNMRAFEVMSTGTPLMTNSDVVGIDDMFDPWVHYIPFKDMDDMIVNCKTALDNPDLQAMGHKAMTEVREKHTYKHRMERVIEVMDGV